MEHSKSEIMDPFHDVQDMSVESGPSWQVVTVLVGSDPEPSTFQVHIQRLGPLATKLGVKPGGEVRLPDEKAETFNLAMNWSYNFRLPRVRDLSEYFLLTKPGVNPGKDYPYESNFSPHKVIDEDRSGFGGNSNDSNRPSLLFMTLSAFPKYSSFSVDELRLYYTATLSAERAEPIAQTEDKDTKAEDPAKPIAQAQDNEAEGAAEFAEPAEEARVVAKKEEPQSAEKQFTPSIMSIPGSIPDGEAIRADAKQKALLELLLFAEKHKWEALFNDAMEAFRHGEAQLRRLYTPASHIYLAFSRGVAPSQVQNFVGDHALSLGFGNNMMTSYRELVDCAPAFFSFMLERMDTSAATARSSALTVGSGSSGGSSNKGSAGAGGNDSTRSTGPADATDRTKLAYHIHSGRFITDCPCPSTRGIFSSSKSDDLPLPIFNVPIRAK